MTDDAQRTAPWVAPSMAPTRRARGLFGALALLQHGLFVEAFSFRGQSGWTVVPFFWTSAPLLVLGWLLFRRADPAEGNPTATALGSVVMLSTLGAMLTTTNVDSALFSALVGCAFVGALAGCALAVGFYPLLGLVVHWRRRGTLAAGLNAWAALALYPMTVGLIVSGMLGLFPQAMLRHLGLALGAAGALIALGVVAVELGWRRRIGRALDGTLPATALVTDVERADEGVPDWSLSPTATRVALVAARPAAGYRESPGREFVAILPARLVASWRLWVLPGLLALLLMRWW